MASIPAVLRRTARIPRSTLHRALHQDGRGPLPHEATPSTTTSPTVHPTPIPPSSSSSHLPPSSSSSHLPLVDLPHQHPRLPPPSLSHTHTAKSPTGRPLLIKEFTPKGKPIYTRPPIPTQVRQQIISSTPNESGSPFDVKRTDGNPIHPLWKFFHVPRSGKMLGLDEGDVGSGAGMGSLDTLDSTAGDSEIMTSGRSWTAQELRTKSFTDLHTIWYLLLRERNVLATQREERRRLGVIGESEIITKRAYRCRKSMARIKYVLNERRLGLISATESTRPSSVDAVSTRSKVVGRSPLGSIDPLAVTGWETGIANRMEAAYVARGTSEDVVVTEVDADADAAATATATATVVSDEQVVAKAEIESR